MSSRRSLLLSLPALAFSAHYARAGLFEAPASTRLYLGTNTRGPEHGIFVADWNGTTGEIGPLTLAANLVMPTFLAQSKRGGETRIYAVSETTGSEAVVSALTTVRGTSTLKLLNQISTLGDGPTHVAVSPDGGSVFVANYGGGSVTSFHVMGDGSLSQPVSHVQFSGKGPYPGRQDAPHTHAVTPSPDGRYLLVNDLGLDRIMVFHAEKTSSRLTAANPPFWQARPGSGPRHLSWSPDGHYVYCTNELDSTVETLQWDASRASLNAVSSASSLPAGFPANKAFVGEVLASRDGHNVYAGNRVADDTIAVFDVDPKTHQLRLTQSANVGGKNTRHIALDPTERWMVICHQNSNDLTVVARDPQTGRLSAPIHSYPAQTPMCALFVQLG
jgi:6-phosphogluconolactonase